MTHEVNQVLERWLAEYEDIYDEYCEFFQKRGVVFGVKDQNNEQIEEVRTDLRRKGACFRNGGASICLNGLSTACEACTGDSGSATFFISLACSRNCYFCFNPNQRDYERYLVEDRDWRAEFDQLSNDGCEMSHIALTGGEPLLHYKEALAFFKEAHRRWPHAHLRLYTNGDVLDKSLMQLLLDAGLSEIRFSIKLDDDAAARARSLEVIRMAAKFEPVDVMVEMPVIPGTLEEMKRLLLELDAAGIFGINLLEFCYPMGSWDAFAQRGFRVKNPPFPVLYDYGYAGGLPIEESELECLKLIEFALDNGLGMSVYYCSLENKHRDQVLTQNRIRDLSNPSYLLDPDDFFYKTCKVFGRDALVAQNIFEQTSFDGWHVDSEGPIVSFHPRLKSLVVGSGLDIVTSYNVIENREGPSMLRELALKRE